MKKSSAIAVAKDDRGFEVEVLAISGIWAMVRRKGFVPFVAEVKKLTFPTLDNPATNVQQHGRPA